ncbi:MAG: MFS transporter [Nitrospiraceae bacterium]|nr:MFS transporter [Nitrospiraceae bacterium]
MTLYEAAFAVVARMLGADYRKAIIVITLFGGLASTVFVPLTQHLVDAYGWRDALRILAVIQLPICAGIPYLLLRDREQASTALSSTKGPSGDGFDPAGARTPGVLAARAQLRQLRVHVHVVDLQPRADAPGERLHDT